MGIFLSRIAGLIRERVFAHYFGNSAAADAFRLALKIPNFLQNLFGEGVLSASFIPVYANLLANGKEEEANRVSGVIGTLLFLLTSVMVLVGLLLAPLFVDIFAPGFEGETRELTVRLVKILFPGTGFLVMSAWCLGILNSHRRFFLSYAAPVLWNASIIAALLIYGGSETQSRLAEWAAWGMVVGSALQFGVQLPFALSLSKKLKPSLAAGLAPVKTVLKNFGPVVVARGVVQVSAYIDNIIASLLPTGTVAALGYAQVLYLLPVSLFGMSVSAAELPAMSGATGTSEDIARKLRDRLNSGLARISFFVVPSMIALLVLGDVIIALLFQTGKFERGDTLYVWTILAGYAIGLLASTGGRLYASAFYALRDTRTPLKFALLRVAVATSLGLIASLWLPPLLELDLSWGALGLTAASGLSSWIEMLLLKRTLQRNIGPTGATLNMIFKLFAPALAGAAIGRALKIWLELDSPLWNAAVVLLPFGLIYFAGTYLLGVSESRSLLGRFIRNKRGRS